MHVTRVSSFTSWIDQTVAGSYDLVLDMNNQPAGNNGSTDHIDVNNVNGMLTLSINGQEVHRRAIGDIRSLTIRGSSDADVINLERIQALLPVTLDGRAGGDTFNMSPVAHNLSNLLGSTINITGGADFDYLYVNDHGNPNSATYTVTNNTVSRPFSGQITYNGLNHIVLNASTGDSTVNIPSTAADTRVTVYARAGNDTITVGNNLGALLGNVTVHGETGTDRLLVQDQLHNGGDTYTIDATTVKAQRVPSLVVTYGGTVEHLVLQTGGGNDTVTIQRVTASATTTVRAGNGQDRLTGDWASNILLGEGGNDILNGGGGRDILIGGLGADVFDAGSGEDILIDGTTSHDASNAALIALLSEWGRNDLGFNARVTNLRNGGGLNGTTRLTSTTVRSDADVDVLTGGSTDRDWFWFGGNPPLFPLPGNPPPPARDTLTDLEGLFLIPYGHANATDNPLILPPF
jgi:Ca2+-binding RTX toxin-like protein